MSRRTKLSLEDKLDIIRRVQSGEKSVLQLVRKFGISHEQIYTYVNFYNKYGVKGVMTREKNTRYPIEIKVTAVQEYLNGEGSFNDIILKYNISSSSVLRHWIKSYKEGKLTTKSLPDSTKRKINKHKAKKFTLDEKLEIVQQCVGNLNNYQATADQFGTSYQQVYTWVKKFSEDGVEALKDKRGKKQSKPLTNEEKLIQKIREQEIQMRKLQAENEFLKKLDELERW
jgi:transposase-like protein